MSTYPWRAVLAGLPLLLSSLLPAPVSASAAAPVQVILDGRTLALDPAPAIVEDRTLVPLRGVLEAMGAVPVWNGETRTVEVRRGDRYVRLKIDRRLACLNPSCYWAATLDVPARIIGDRTFVPVRFLSQALGARVSWDPDRRAVVIDTAQEPVVQPAPVSIPTVLPGSIVRGPITLTATGASGTAVQFYLLDPATGSGPMVAAGADPAAAYTFTPDPTHAGIRLLVAGVRENPDVMRFSDPIALLVMPEATVRLTGVDPGGLVTGPVTLGSEVSFVATQVAYQLTDVATGSVEKLGTVGPGDSLTWYPQIGQTGEKRLQAVATDRSGKTYESEPVPVNVQSGYRQVLAGIKDGAVVSRPVTLRVSANYPIQAVQYLLDEQLLGEGQSFSWTFGPEANGTHALRVLITGTDGVVRSPDPVHFTVNTSAQVWPSGIGPNQVVTGPVTLKASASVPVSVVEYHLVDERSASVELLGRTAPGESFTWTPGAAHAGDRRLQAIAVAQSGDLVQSELVSFRVFPGKVYGPQPVVPKAEFQGLASRLSVPVYRETGMSAALQAAQAILETGWGQSGPVDKYTGQVSYNLFGIKGQGPAGSVISNTWEEYNGATYRIDAQFRAYHSIQESWRDHADLLLQKSWYAPFRAVMADPVLGAWALRRSGYATDSQYPVKLINIMKTYDLFKLDQIEL